MPDRSRRLPALVARLLLLALVATAAVAGRAGATCPEFPPPPNPVLHALEGVTLIVTERANPDAPQYRWFVGRLPDGTVLPRMHLQFPAGAETLEAQVLAALAPGGEGLALVGDYAETMIMCGVAGGMRLHSLTVTGLATP